MTHSAKVDNGKIAHSSASYFAVRKVTLVANQKQGISSCFKMERTQRETPFFLNFMKVQKQLKTEAQPAIHFRGGIFMKFRSMTSSCLFNRGTTFSQTVTDKVLFATFPKMRTFEF